MDNRHKTGQILLGILAGGLGILWLTYSMGVMIPCPFKAVTGIPCPSCGGMRSLDALIHGDYVQALRINPLSVLLIVGIACSCLWLTWDLLRDTNTFNKTIKKLNNRSVLWFVIALLVANWCRNIFLGL